MFKKGLALGSAAARLVAQEVRERRNPPVIERDGVRSNKEDRSEPFAAALIQPAELDALLADGTPPLLLDCRDEVEWVAGYIDGASHIPMTELPERADRLDTESSVVVVCLNGVESAEVAEYLLNHKGFKDVRVLDGGMVGWYADMGQQRIHVLRDEERIP